MKLEKKTIFIITLVVLFIGALIWWAAFKQKRDSLVVSGTVQAFEVQFGSRQGGRVTKVVAKEGETLKPGDLILEIEATELLAQDEAMKATIESQKAYISELENGTRPDQIAAAKANYERARADYLLTARGNRKEDINSAKAQMDSAKSDLERASQSTKRRQKLFSEELISKDQLEEAERNLTVNQKKYEEAKENYQKVVSGFRKEEIERNLFNMQSFQANYQDLAKGTRPERLEAERKKLQVYEAQLREIKAKLKELYVVSPCNCELSEFEIEPGTLLLPNQVLGTLVNLNDLWVDAYLPQEAYGKVWPGDLVEIESLSYTGKKLYGKVRFVGLKAEFTPRNIQTIEGRKQEVFKVKVALNNRQKLFRPGMDLNLNFHFHKRGEEK